MAHSNRKSDPAKHLEEVRNFVTPATSPVWRSAARNRLLLSDPNAWAALWMCDQRPIATTYREIWKSVLLVAAGGAWRLMREILGWPLWLLWLLFAEDAQKVQVSVAFAALRLCCTPRGTKDLRMATTSASTCKAPWFMTLLLEFAVQLVWANHENEVQHANLRGTLQATGQRGDLTTAVVRHSFAQLRMHHQAVLPAQPKRRRGRPVTRGPKTVSV